MNNCLLRDPIRVHIVDSDESVLKTFVFVGSVPTVVKNTFEQINTSGKVSNGALKTLKTYYGSSLKNFIGKTVGGDDDLTSGGDDLTTGGAASDIVIDLDDIDIRIDDADLLADDSSAVAPSVEKKQTKKVAKPAVQKKFNINEDMTELLFEPDGRVFYETTVSVYPEDKISELRDKIMLATGIPAYRQHIYAYENGRMIVPYRIHNADGIVDVLPMRSLDRSTTDNILGIPIDKMLYRTRADVTVETQEPFMLIANVHTRDYYIVDFATLVKTQRAQFGEIIGDSYKFELFYWGFVVKYFALLLPEVLTDYMRNENDLVGKYPDMVKNMGILRRTYNAEKSIIDHMYSVGKRSDVTVSIVNMLVTTKMTSTCTINIRNLFDALSVSSCMPQIVAYVEHAGKRFVLQKTHVKNQSLISTPAVLRSGLIIAISLRKRDQETFHAKSSVSTIENEQSRYMYLCVLPTGKYMVKMLMNEEDGYDFASALRVIKKFTDETIGKINAMGREVFITGHNIQVLNSANMYIKSLGVSVFWKKTVPNASVFGAIKSQWEQYTRAGIISSRGLASTDSFEFMFRKGMTEFDTSVIERVLSMAHLETMRNHYTRFTNPILKTKWQQLYEGRVVRMSQRTTDIKFDIANIKEQEFAIFICYIYGFVATANSAIRGKATETSISKTPTGPVKKLKKLRELDPELYNLKKHGSNKVYSILCQSPRQPLIISDDEHGRLSVQEKQKLIKYYNFTLNRPAFYRCPSAKYSHLSFIVGVHPRGYCLPCCGKTAAVADSKKEDVLGECLQKHRYDVGDKDIPERKHVMNYGKTMQRARVTKLPSGSLHQLLYNTLDDNTADYFIYTTDQTVTTSDYSSEDIGVLNALAYVFEVSAEQMLDRLLTDLDIVFMTLVHGKAFEIFGTAEKLSTHLKSLIAGIAVDIKFRRYNELFIELASHRGIVVFTFADDTGRGDNIELICSDVLISTIKQQSVNSDSIYVMMLRGHPNSYYPIVALNPTEYFADSTILHRTFTNSHAIVENITAVISSKAQLSTNTFYIDLSFVKQATGGDAKGLKLTKKYINLRNLVYGVELTNGPKTIYIPVSYSANIADKIPRTTDVLVRSELCSHDDLIATMKILGIVEVPATYLKHNDAFIGMIMHDLVFYFRDSADIQPLAGATITTIPYDPSVVNSAIAKVTPPNDARWKTLAAQGLYANMVYRLYIGEFVNYIESERNTKMRKQIIGLFNETNFKTAGINSFQDAIRKLLVDFPTDYNVIVTLLTEYYYEHFNKEQFVSAITARVFEFDKITLRELKMLPREKLVTTLISLSKSFTEQKDIGSTITKFDNVYSGCSATGKSPEYCSKRKLIVPDLQILCELLADDLRNELISSYMFNGLFSENTINFFSFNARKHESISIVAQT